VWLWGALGGGTVRHVHNVRPLRGDRGILWSIPLLFARYIAARESKQHHIVVKTAEGGQRGGISLARCKRYTPCGLAGAVVLS
jgi:hypothetical protein